MAIQKGRQQYVAIKTEASRLVAETTGFTKFIPFEEFSAMNENIELEDRSGYNNRGALLSKYVMGSEAKKSLGGKIDADILTNLLYYVFGSANPTTASGATTWNYSVLQSTELPTYTTQFLRADEGFKRLRGCSINKIDLDWSLDDGKFTIEVPAIAEETGNSQTVAYAAPTKYIMGRHITAYLATSLAGLGSATAPTGTQFKIRSLKVSFENGVTAIREFSSALPTNVTANGFKATGEFELLLSTANNASGFQTAFEAGTKQAFRFHAVATDQSAIGASSLKPTLSIALPPSQIKVEPGIPLDDYLTQKISFEVEMPNLTAVTLINAISAL